jgi:REase_MTES_1575
VVAGLAARQHGVVGHWQLRRLGLTRGEIESKLRRGLLHRVFLGSYAVGHPVLGISGRRLAAVLACGPGSLLSHREAAAHWGLLRVSRTAVDVTAPGRSRHRRPGIDVHLPRRLEECDGTERDGIPVTTVARTLLDLAEVVDGHRLARALEESERIGLFDMTAVLDVCARARGRRGLRPLRRALGAYVEPPPLIRSELERQFAALCRGAGLPRPAFNAIVEGMEVDAVWESYRLAVELDGRSFHATRAAFERDRRRDAALVVAGYRVLRISARRLREDRRGVIADLRRLLGPPPR